MHYRTVYGNTDKALKEFESEYTPVSTTVLQEGKGFPAKPPNLTLITTGPTAALSTDTTQEASGIRPGHIGS